MSLMEYSKQETDEDKPLLFILVAILASQIVLMAKAYEAHLVGAPNIFAIFVGLLLILFAEAAYVGKILFYE